MMPRPAANAARKSESAASGLGGAQNAVQKFPSPVLGDTRFLLLTALILGSLRRWDVSRGTWGRLLRYAEGGEEKAAGREQKALRHAPKQTSAVRSVRDAFHPVHSAVCQFLDAERPVRVGITAPTGAGAGAISDFGLPLPCATVHPYRLLLLPTVLPQSLAPASGHPGSEADRAGPARASPDRPLPAPAVRTHKLRHMSKRPRCVL